MTLRRRLMALVLLALSASPVHGQLEPLTDTSLCELFLVSWPQVGLPDSWETALSEGRASGVRLLPGTNYLLPEELTELTSKLHALQPQGLPLLLMAPSEGGIHGVLHPLLGGASIPDPLALGALPDTFDRTILYETLYQDLCKYGVHIGMGPLLALSNQQGSLHTAARSLGSDALRVSMLLGSMMAAAQRSGVLAAPVYRGDPVPNQADILVVDDEAKDPLALARGLRENAKYAGVLVSPPLDQEDTNVVAALNAGFDWIQVSAASPTVVDKAIRSILDAINVGTLSRERIEEALGRVRALRQRVDEIVASTAPSEKPQLDELPNGVVVVRDPEGLLPLDTAIKKVLVVCPAAELPETGSDARFIGATLGGSMRAIGGNVNEIRVGLDPSPAQVEQAQLEAKASEVIVVGVLAIPSHPAQQLLLERLRESGRPLVIVGLDDPANLEPYVDYGTIVAANGYGPSCLASTAQALLGKVLPQGHLPAPIGRLFPAGYVGR